MTEREFDKAGAVSVALGAALLTAGSAVGIGGLADAPVQEMHTAGVRPVTFAALLFMCIVVTALIYLGRKG